MNKKLTVTGNYEIYLDSHNIISILQYIPTIHNYIGRYNDIVFTFYVDTEQQCPTIKDKGIHFVYAECRPIIYQ